VDDRLSRHDLTDAEWALLTPLMPGHPRQGHRWKDHRTVVNGIMFRTRTGCPWRDLPERYGNWKTLYGRHRRWSGDGTWEKIVGALRAGCDQAEGAAWTVAADAAVVRAHQHAAGARHAPPKDVDPERLAPAVLAEPARFGGGRSTSSASTAPSPPATTSATSSGAGPRLLSRS
jgi:transposase